MSRPPFLPPRSDRLVLLLLVVTALTPASADVPSPLLNVTRTDPCEFVGGVPLGGLGAGSVEIRGDGSFREWQIFNNWGNTPKVVFTKNNTFPSFDLLNALGAVKIDNQAYVLETHPAGHLPGVATVKYEGWFPFANLEYGLGDGAPVAISLEAFGSYIPHDANASALPAIGLTYHFKNTSAKAVQVRLALSLVNPLGSDCKEESTGQLKVAESVHGPAGVGVAALDGTAASFLGGPDSPETLKAFWTDLTGASPQPAPARPGQCFGEVVSFQLQPGEEKSERFVIGWFFPDHHENATGPLVGHKYEAWSDSAAASVKLFASRFDELRQRSAAWRDTMRDASWPDWVTRWLCNSQSTIVKNTWWVKDGRFMNYESTECANSSPVHIIDLADWPLLDAFPEIELNLLRRFAEKQYENGKVPEEFAVHTTPSVTFVGGRNLYDVNPKFVMEIYHRWRETGDRAFLDATWPAVKKAVLYNDTKFDGLHIGMPSGKKIESTWDHWTNEYAFSYGGSLWLGALKAAQELAQVENDPAFGAQAQAMSGKALATMDDHFWNGDFYAMTLDQDLRPNHISFVESTYGDVFARFIGLGAVLPDDKALATLRAIAKYNSAPTPFGLVITADTSGKMIEYHHDVRGQITTCHAIPAPIALIQQGNAADQATGLSLLKKIYSIADLHPGGLWNMPHHAVAGTGERNVHDFTHYLRDRCIWALLKVLNGWSFDAADQSLAIGPVLSPEKCHGPWICPTAYGTLAQEFTGGTQVDSLKTQEGALTLIEIDVFSRVGKIGTAKVTLDGTTVAVTDSQNGNQVKLRFSTAAKLTAGSDLEINLAGSP